MARSMGGSLVSRREIRGQLAIDEDRGEQPLSGEIREEQWGSEFQQKIQKKVEEEQRHCRGALLRRTSGEREKQWCNEGSSEREEVEDDDELRTVPRVGQRRAHEAAGQRRTSRA